MVPGAVPHLHTHEFNLIDEMGHTSGKVAMDAANL